MTGAASKLTKFLDEAGCDDQAKRYVAERKIISTEIFASLADTADELDMVLLEPLKAEFKFSDGSAFKPDQLELPVLRAKFRRVWRQSCDEIAAAAKVLGAPPPATVAPSRASKELAAGYWEAQIAKYESKLVGSEPRVFPQEMLLGAEAIVARVANEMKTGVHTAIALHEVVQNRYFNAAHDPNPLCSAKKRARQQTTVLTINAENQLEAEEESPWQPKSVLAFIDCVESIKFLMILVELGPESSVVQFCDWFVRVVRARQNKLEQLRVYWDTVAWKLALALRKKDDFADTVNSIMNDSQTLQDAVNREIATVDNKSLRMSAKAEAMRLPWGKGGKANGKGKYKGKRTQLDDARWDDRWGSDRRWDDRRSSPYGGSWKYQYHRNQDERYHHGGGRWPSHNTRGQYFDDKQSSRE